MPSWFEPWLPGKNQWVLNRFHGVFRSERMKKMLKLVAANHFQIPICIRAVYLCIKGSANSKIGLSVISNYITETIYE